jgi:hypothetical protein
MKIRSGGRLMLLLKEREETEEGDEKIFSASPYLHFSNRVRIIEEKE